MQFAGLCERIFEVGLPWAMTVCSKIPNPNLQVFMQKNDDCLQIFMFLLKKSVFFATSRKELKRNLQISNIFCNFAI